jgi:hypothetical protein
VDTTESSVFQSSVFRPSQVDQDHHPHACWGGVVYIAYTAYDEEVGDEVEVIEAVPCRRCSEAFTPAVSWWQRQEEEEAPDRILARS